MLSRHQIAKLKSEPISDGGNRIRAARRLAGVTQVQVGAVIGLPQSQISADEAGKSADISLQKARAYADYFGCAIEDIFPSREAVAS